MVSNIGPLQIPSLLMSTAWENSCIYIGFVFLTFSMHGFYTLIYWVRGILFRPTFLAYEQTQLYKLYAQWVLPIHLRVDGLDLYLSSLAFSLSGNANLSSLVAFLAEQIMLFMLVAQISRPSFLLILDDWLRRERFVLIGFFWISYFSCSNRPQGGWFTGTTFLWAVRDYTLALLERYSWPVMCSESLHIWAAIHLTSLHILRDYESAYSPVMSSVFTSLHIIEQLFILRVCIFSGYEQSGLITLALLVDSQALFSRYWYA